MKPNAPFIEVTAARPYDPIVIALCAEQRVELEGRYDDSGDIAGRVGAGTTFLVARSRAEPVGCAGLEPLEPGVAEIRRMYVRPAHRGQGISRRLLAAVEDLARDRGFGILRPETGELQPEALGLYQSAGYVRIPPFGGYAGNTRSLCFEKRLTGAADQRAARPGGLRRSGEAGPRVTGSVLSAHPPPHTRPGAQPRTNPQDPGPTPGACRRPLFGIRG